MNGKGKTQRRLPKMYSVREITEQTNIPRTTIYDAVNRGDLPAVRLGNNRGRGPHGLRVTEDDALHWIESRRERAT